jgi:enoyl-CoA hydratase/carnithine racemase
MTDQLKSSYEAIKARVEGPVLLLTLNRPERLNAWTPQMMADLAHAIEVANNDPAIGAIVVTGEGRGFCAGADMSVVFKSQIDGEGDAGARAPVDWIALCRRSKPLIAAVNGPAVGIGVTMILPFDVIVASEAAKFATPFVKMGIVPELASSHFLTARMGLGRASELVLTARQMSGKEASEKGLADYLATPEGLLDEAFRIANLIAANPDRMLRMAKKLLAENALEPDWKIVQAREMEQLKICYETPEHKEAVSAFMEKRKANFR